MLACAKELVQIIQARQPALTKLGIDAAAHTPGLSAYSPADLEQMVAGFIALLTEALEERGRDTMTFYTDTVIPGLVANGDSVPKIIHAVMFFSVTQITDLVPHIPEQHRTEAAVWLAKFYAEYMSEIVASGIAASKG